MGARGRGKQYRLVRVNDTLAPVASIEDPGIQPLTSAVEGTADVPDG